MVLYINTPFVLVYVTISAHLKSHTLTSGWVGSSPHRLGRLATFAPVAALTAAMTAALAAAALAALMASFTEPYINIFSLCIHMPYTVPYYIFSLCKHMPASPPPSKSAAAIKLVITLSNARVPSPALSNARLGPPSFPSSTSRLSSPSPSAAAIEPHMAQGQGRRRRRWWLGRRRRGRRRRGRRQGRRQKRRGGRPGRLPYDLLLSSPIDCKAADPPARPPQGDGGGDGGDGYGGGGRGDGGGGIGDGGLVERLDHRQSLRIIANQRIH